MLKAGHFVPMHEAPSAEYPMQLVSGRTIYHFHTRTKTGRARELRDAAPEVWAELTADDAESIGVAEGDDVDITTPRGVIRAGARISHSRSGVVFVPFHYGYWDTDDVAGPTPSKPGRAANEVTMTDWDPVSKQPTFKVCACRVATASPRGSEA
jgi:anaerobic selenocysteine-containing dehydrogenase